jgi:hypothetical protein
MTAIYAINHFNFIDRIVKKKRQEMLDIINNKLKDIKIHDALDIGTTNDQDYQSSNFLIKNLINISEFKSVSDQYIDDKFFSKILTRSITDNFTNEEIDNFKSDLVISNATIEHVGNFENQIKMVKNVAKLARKFFVITTPNRYHPLDFHTKLPFLHWMPKNVHRSLLNFIGLNYFAKEENLNLFSEQDLNLCIKESGIKNYEIFYINLLGFKSNFLIFGKIV